MILNMLSLQRKLLTKATQISARNISVGSPLKKNLYEALGLTREATQTDIKNAYFQLSKIYHPDRIAATDENLARFREISDAYEVLGNEQSRRLYDRGLIGDFRKPGVDDSSEVTDPIIKFYQDRHAMRRPKASEDLDLWAEEYYKKVKESGKSRSKFYTVSKSDIPPLDKPSEDLYMIVILAILAFLWSTNYRGSFGHKAWDYMVNLGTGPED